MSKYCSRVFLNHYIEAKLILHVLLHVYLCMCIEIFYVPISSSEMLVFLYLSLCAKYLLLEDIVLTFRNLSAERVQWRSIYSIFEWNYAFDKVLQQTCETPHQRNGAVEHTLTADSFQNSQWCLYVNPVWTVFGKAMALLSSAGYVKCNLNVLLDTSLE